MSVAVAGIAVAGVATAAGVGRYWGPRRVWIAPRIVVGPRVVVRRGYNAHARWCMSRYASYNPRTNTFLAYDGYYKRCVSPY